MKERRKKEQNMHRIFGKDIPRYSISIGFSFNQQQVSDGI